MRVVFFLMGVMFPMWVIAVPLDIRYGVNEVDVNGDGVKDVIVRLRWENGNAHSFDRYVVAVHRGGEWLEVPLGDKQDTRFITAEGADCVTEDDRAFHVNYTFELVGGKPHLRVTSYTRVWEEGLEKYPVYKTVYELKARQGMLVGFPDIWLEKGKPELLKERVCDVRSVMPRK
ncbi:MAG: hypothetical protein WAZ18_06430 [Alphaproteobacteria bacterium]